MSAPALETLVVEDNPGDVLLLAEAVERAGLAARLHVVEDGREALAFLRRSGPHAAAPRPDLIVLDLNLPVMSGREVLAELAAAPELHEIPVAVLTTSRIEASICDGYPAGRCRYFVKPGDFFELVQIVCEIARFARGAPAAAAGAEES